ncbi:MAG TPA: protein-L-isoaspartate O-methyltransferase [Thiotrichaceae bacterium]|jgi:protein-L-isoaspartate(D-aspartate) O-methyltransferase|nr:protein-L-isoaspartate O-methyltransferase [Thiotrichaceae bacterium]HIM08765.1 protein-L-isoaspartate O-methyltransferase [Gammaproteobacteria bacterium]
MDIEQARFNMIEQQIRTWDVLDMDVLELFNEIHREEFIPDAYRELSFADTRIPLGHNQTTMTPKVEARLLQAIALKGDETVLEIGTGCGYLTTLLAKSAKHVRSIDIFPDFIKTANDNIIKTGLVNIELENIDVYSLFDQSEKYDVLVLTASLPEMDNRFLRLLNNGGRMFAIIGESPAMEACVLTKQDDSNYTIESFFEIDLPALIGAEQKESFEF